MKNSLDSERKKRKTLIAILVGVLMLLLGDCVGGIEWKAQQYLSNQYSGEFTIISSERMVNERGPIPVLVSSYYWKLTVKSTQFPSETFSVYYEMKWKNPAKTLLKKYSAPNVSLSPFGAYLHGPMERMNIRILKKVFLKSHKY